MMILPTKKEEKLYKLRDKTSDPKKIEEIGKELIEIDNEKLKVFNGNCPFAH